MTARGDEPSLRSGLKDTGGRDDDFRLSSDGLSCRALGRSNSRWPPCCCWWWCAASLAAMTSTAGWSVWRAASERLEADDDGGQVAVSRPLAEKEAGARRGAWDWAWWLCCWW